MRLALTLGLAVGAVLVAAVAGRAADPPRLVMMASTIGPIDAGIVSEQGEPLFFPNSDQWRRANPGG